MNTHNLPPAPSSGEFTGNPEILTPEEMVRLATELLDGFGAEFPELGEIPVELNTDKSGKPKDGFESGLSAKKVYIPGVGSRPLYDPTERTGADDPRQKDFATWFVQCFGKTVTSRQRTLSGLPEPEGLQHAKIPKIVRGLLDVTKNEDEIVALMDEELVSVIAHNLGLPVQAAEVEKVWNIYIEMINKLNVRLGQRVLSL